MLRAKRSFTLHVFPLYSRSLPSMSFSIALLISRISFCLPPLFLPVVFSFHSLHLFHFLSLHPGVLTLLIFLVVLKSAVKQICVCVYTKRETCPLIKIRLTLILGCLCIVVISIISISISIIIIIIIIIAALLSYWGRPPCRL